MTPNKAIAIVLILFVLVAAFFVFLYMQKQLVGQISQINSQMPSTNQASLLEVNAKDMETQRNIRQVLDMGKNEYGGITDQAKATAETIANQNIQEKLNSRTPEQIEADKKHDEEISKMIEEANK